MIGKNLQQAAGLAAQVLGHSKLCFAQVWMRSLPAALTLGTALETIGVVRTQLGHGELLRAQGEQLAGGLHPGAAPLAFVEHQANWVERICGLAVLCAGTQLTLGHLATQYPDCKKLWDKLLSEEANQSRYARQWIARLASAGGRMTQLTRDALVTAQVCFAEFLAADTNLEAGALNSALALCHAFLAKHSSGAL